MTSAASPRLTLGKLVILQAVLAFLFSFNGVTPVSSSLFFLLPISAIFMAGHRRLPYPLFWWSILALYILISTLIYSPECFGEFDFYRRDGNFFLTYAPLFVIYAFSSKGISINFFSILTSWLAVINLFFLIIYFLTGGTILFHEPGLYHILFAAHNAAGGFLATLCAFQFAILLKSGMNRQRIALFIISLIGLYETDSRGSLIGLALGILTWFLLRNRPIRLFLIILISLQLIVGAISWKLKPSGYLDLNDFATENISLSGERSGTIVNRVAFLWPRAIYLFGQSPLVGTGFGSFNDRPYNLVGVPGLACINRPEQHINGDNHAHQSFFHVAAETGIFGVMILIMALGSSLRYFRSNGTQEDLMVDLGFRTSIFSSMTEHRLFTPSQMLPITLLFGMLLAKRAWNSSKSNNTKQYLDGTIEKEN